MAIIRYDKCKACGFRGECEVTNFGGSIKAFCKNKQQCQLRIERSRKGGPGRPKK